MAKMSKAPVIIDKILCISTRDLKQLCFFDSAGYKSESISVTRISKITGLKEVIATIQISVSIQPDNWYVCLEYEVDGHPITCKFDLQQVPSNLGKGSMWYMICCATKRRIRKIYLLGTQFVSRPSISDCLYSDQVIAKSGRRLNKIIKLYNLNKKIIEKLTERDNTPYLKSHYRGMPTKREKLEDKLRYYLLQQQRIQDSKTRQ